MTVILSNRVLEARRCGASSKMLRPLLAVHATCDEPGIHLCLEDEDRVETQHQVVDLRQAPAVRQDDIMQRRRAQKRQLTRDGRLALLSGNTGFDLPKRLSLFVGDEVGPPAATGGFQWRATAGRFPADQAAGRASSPPARRGHQRHCDEHKVRDDEESIGLEDGLHRRPSRSGRVRS
jgi:hypothetical protein